MVRPILKKKKIDNYKNATIPVEPFEQLNTQTLLLRSDFMLYVFAYFHMCARKFVIFIYFLFSFHSSQMLSFALHFVAIRCVVIFFYFVLKMTTHFQQSHIHKCKAFSLKTSSTTTHSTCTYTYWSLAEGGMRAKFVCKFFAPEEKRYKVVKRSNIKFFLRYTGNRTFREYLWLHLSEHLLLNVVMGAYVCA